MIAGDADAFAIPADTSVVVLDPPRAGAPGAARAIAASSAKVVVYVSCEPTTLARDLGTLAGGRLAVTHVETFELFPQTSHVETVVRLQRALADGRAFVRARAPRNPASSGRDDPPRRREAPRRGPALPPRLRLPRLRLVRSRIPDRPAGPERCSLGYPHAPHRDPDLDGRAEVTFCKAFEAG